LALLLGAVGFYLPVLTNLAVLIATNEDYSFGLLLPLVSAYIIYLKWPQIRQGDWQPSWMELAIITLGFGLYIFGEMAASLYIPSISFTLTLAGIEVLLGVWGLLRILAFPLVLLVLMVPVEGYVLRRVTLPLQLISSHLATWFLQSVGVPVVRQGNVIDLGVRQLKVVAACSGLWYILSLFALGTIFCYFYQRRVWKAAIIMISVIPAALLANALRVAAMGLLPALQEGKHFPVNLLLLCT
jgi:exosortase